MQRSPTFLRETAKAVERDFLAPKGLKVPDIPIRWSVTEEGFYGVTVFRSNGGQSPTFIEISSRLGDQEAAAVVAHELIHSVLPVWESHGPIFKSIAKEIGVWAPTPDKVSLPFKQWFAAQNI